MDKRILELRSNWSFVVPYLQSLATLMNALDEADILSDLLIDSIINLSPANVKELVIKPVSFDIIPFFHAASFFYQHLGSYQHLYMDTLLNYQPKAISLVLNACQKIAKYTRLTPDIVNKILLMSADQLNEIQLCLNQYDIFRCLAGRARPSTRELLRPASSTQGQHNYVMFFSQPQSAVIAPRAPRKPLIIETAAGERVDIVDLVAQP